MFHFLFYQSRRSKRTSGKKRKHPFDFEEYKKYRDAAQLCAEQPVGYSIINQYYSGIIDLHQFQVDNGANNVTKQMLWSNRVTLLLNNVKKRKKTLAKQNFEEKLTSEFAPYTTAGEVLRIEYALFEHNKTSTIYSVSSLRDRFCMLMTMRGVL